MKNRKFSLHYALYATLATVIIVVIYVVGSVILSLHPVNVFMAIAFAVAMLALDLVGCRTLALRSAALGMGSIFRSPRAEDQVVVPSFKNQLIYAGLNLAMIAVLGLVYLLVTLVFSFKIDVGYLICLWLVFVIMEASAVNTLANRVEAEGPGFLFTTKK